MTTAEGLQFLDEPVFIVGAPRSGTTWLQRLLVEHPAICGGRESNFFRPVEVALVDFDNCASMKRAIGMPTYWSEQELIAWYRDLWRRTMAKCIQTGAEAVLVEKTPMHSVMIPTILRVLPRARFIHVVRDSRAVVASLRAAARAEWGRDWAPRRVRAAARLWRRFNQAAARDAGGSSSNYTLVHYEDLMTSPEAELRRLLALLGVESKLEEVQQWVHQHSFDVQRARSADGATEPRGFHRRGEIDSWRNELNFLQRELVWRMTCGLMRQFGYSKAGRIGA